MQLVRVTCLFTGHYNTDLHVAYIDVIYFRPWESATQWHFIFIVNFSKITIYMSHERRNARLPQLARTPRK